MSVKCFSVVMQNSNRRKLPRSPCPMSIPFSQKYTTASRGTPIHLNGVRSIPTTIQEETAYKVDGYICLLHTHILNFEVSVLSAAGSDPAAHCRNLPPLSKPSPALWYHKSRDRSILAATSKFRCPSRIFTARIALTSSIL